MVLEHMVLSNILLYPLLQKCGIEQLINHGAKFSISKEGLNRNHHKFKLYLQTGHLPSGCAECYILPSMSVQINKGYTILLSWVQDQDKTKTRQSLSWKTKTKPRQDKLCLGKTKTGHVLVLSCLGVRPVLLVLVQKLWKFLVLSWVVLVSWFQVRIFSSSSAKFGIFNVY